jgi:hypothetical protein
LPLLIQRSSPNLKVERIAEGGLLMVATRDTFIPGNPA